MAPHKGQHLAEHLSVHTAFPGTQKAFKKIPVEIIRDKMGGEVVNGELGTQGQVMLVDPFSG